MELLVLRHGKSSWKDLFLDDFDRPLKGRGRRNSETMGRFIQDHGLLPDHILCSTAKRAAQTLERAMRHMRISQELVHWSRDYYHAEVETWMQALAETPGAKQRVMVVGHNPGLEDLVIHLAKDPVTIPEDGKLVPTATLARLEIETDWKDIGPGAGRLINITRPKSLAERIAP